MDYANVETLIAQALGDAVPETFRVRWLDRERGWAIEKVRVAPGEWPNQDYLLWVTADGEWLTASYGNTDHGVGPRAQTTLSLPVAALQPPETAGRIVREFLARLLTCKPNEWGYT